MNGLRLRPEERITDLAPRLRCRVCDAKGRTVVSMVGVMNSGTSSRAYIAGRL